MVCIYAIYAIRLYKLYTRIVIETLPSHNVALLLNFPAHVCFYRIIIFILHRIDTT